MLFVSDVRVLFRRTLALSRCRYKVQPKNLKGKSRTAQDWLTRQLNDPYVKKSRYDNYRARSAYKLLEINEKFKILKPGHVVVECGAAPGSWTQVVVEQVNSDGKNACAPVGKAIALDIIIFDHVPGSTILCPANFLLPESQEQILHHLDGKRADVVLSDMAPTASGIKELDHDSIISLAYSAFIFSIKVLQVGGTFLCKVWDGGRTPKLSEDMKAFFNYVSYVKPHASRMESAELFLLGREFKGAEKV
ncbi:rRNA methyltransferase 2, mitochondrial-like [Ornithodoros turicata]|uniref:rRNA methyltransferase 2, mitochondrial-like n=1 Tax=Ornithodoros turicata TaxID=34597 RepID=UPI00313935F4